MYLSNLDVLCIYLLCIGKTRPRGCDTACPQNYQPICGSNGKTYSNECAMKVDSCQDGTTYTKNHDGPCREGDWNDATIFSLCIPDGDLDSLSNRIPAALCWDPLPKQLDTCLRDGQGYLHQRLPTEQPKLSTTKATRWQPRRVPTCGSRRRLLRTIDLSYVCFLLLVMVWDKIHL